MKRILLAAGLLLSLSTSAQHTLRIDPAQTSGIISPLIYGSGTEDVNHENYGGLYDQLLFGESFCEPPHDEREVQQVSGMWEAVGDGTFRWTEGGVLGATHHQEVEGAAGAGIANRGLNHWGISVQDGKNYHGWLMVRGTAGSIRVSLESKDGRRTYFSCTLPLRSKEWKQLEFDAKAKGSDPDARFVIRLAGRGMMAVGKAVLHADEPTHPFRADITDAFRQEHLTFLRYGGTMVNAREFMTAGMLPEPREMRPPYIGHWYKYNTNGFAIPEFVQFARLIGTEPTFSVNIEDSPADVLRLLEKIDADSQRQGHGRLRWIEIGNEECIGTTDQSAYDHYCDRFLAFYDAIHPVYPDLQFINAAWWRPERLGLMEHVFRRLDGKSTLWDYHPWTEKPSQALEAERTLRAMQQAFLQWNSQTDMRCAILEENGNTHDHERALAHAVMLNVVRRSNGFVQMDSPANALQPYLQNDNGWDQGQIFFSPSQVWMQPPYYAQQMAATAHQSALVGSLQNEGIDVTVTRGEDGTLVIHAVNFAAAEQTLTLDAPVPLTFQPAQVLAADLQARNLPESPESIAPRTQPVHNGQTLRLPAHSYVVVRAVY